MLLYHPAVYCLQVNGRNCKESESPKYTDFIHYRIDRMSSGILIEQQMRKLPKIEDPYEYAKNKLFMYAGEMIPVSFLCNEKILDQIIDIFGRDAFISKREDGKFVLSTRTSKKGAIFLAQQFLDSIQILEPEDLRNEFAKDLQSALAGYLENQ